MEKVEAPLKSPASKDPYSSDMPPAERKKQRAAEGVFAMIDYRNAQHRKLDNMAKLRAERLGRATAVNKPVGENARKVRKSTKPDKTDRKSVAVKKTTKIVRKREGFSA